MIEHFNVKYWQIKKKNVVTLKLHALKKDVWKAQYYQ